MWPPPVTPSKPCSPAIPGELEPRDSSACAPHEQDNNGWAHLEPEKTPQRLDIPVRCRYNLSIERKLSKQETADRMAHECIAVRVRLINRVITALYDEALRPFELRISQANILAAIAKMGEARPPRFRKSCESKNPPSAATWNS